MECKFVVDQKVVCIADAWHVGFADPVGTMPPSFPVKDSIYTIDAVKLVLNVPMLQLRELGDVSLWHHVGFRPLQDRPKEADTDISVFLPALNVKKLEPVQ